MIWPLVEKIIVIVLLSAAAVYLIWRIYTFFASPRPPCSGCDRKDAVDGCSGCSFRKGLAIAAVFFSATSLSWGQEPMKLTSPDIRPGDYIPVKFTCQGRDIPPRLQFINIPEQAKSLALIVHDPDAPAGDRVHWVVFNIPVTELKIDEGRVPGIEGRNGSGEDGWEGPCPPSGTHHYIFNGYALDIELDLNKGAARQEVEAAMQGHVLDKTELVGLYEKF